MDELTNNKQCEDLQMEKEVQEEKIASQQTAYLNRLSVEYFQKYACTQFFPLTEFLSQQHCAQIVQSKPSFQPTISKSLRDNLKVERQIQYLKGSLRQQHIYSTIQQELSSDIKYEPIGRRGNVMVDYDGRLYWCYETKLNCLELNQAVKYQKSQEGKAGSKGQRINNRANLKVMKKQPKELLNLKEHIYQVKRSRNLLIMRAARNLFIYDLISQQIEDSLPFKNQILTFWLDSIRQQLLYVSLTDGHKTEIQLINLTQKSAQILSNQTLIHTAWNIHSNWAIACAYDSVQSLDFRVKLSQQLRKTQEACRIFGATSLSSKVFSENYFMTSQSFHTKIFDLRKPEKMLVKINHFCEQAPPTILSIHDSKEEIVKDEKIVDLLAFGESQEHMKSNKVFLIATNPYVFGSSLLTEISTEMICEKWFEKGKQINNFELLFDKGKLEKGYHSLSSQLLQFEIELGIIHLDNWGGISFELFQKEKVLNKQNKEKKQNIRRCQFSKQCGFEQMKAPNQDWLINNRLSMFLKQEKQDSWYASINEDSMDLELIEDTFKTKYLRYSDLKKFYNQLSLQKHENLPNILDEEEKELLIFKTLKEKQNQNVFNSLQSTFAESGQVNFRRPLFSEKLFQQLSKDWQQSYFKL